MTGGTAWGAYCVSNILLDIYLIADPHHSIWRNVSSTLQTDTQLSERLGDLLG